MTASTMQSMSRAECVRLLGTAVVGRVVYSDAALPACLPVNFAVHGNAVVLRTSANSRLASATDDAVVAFEVDEIDVATRSGWSVLVTGPAERVRDESTLLRLEQLGLVSWAGAGRNTWVRIPLAVVTGRRLLPAAKD